MKRTIEYTPEKCESCGQTTSYASRLNRGIFDIVRSFARAIDIKGINAIHPLKEIAVGHGTMSARERIEQGKLTVRQIGNLTHVVRHGLLAHIDGEPHTFCLTKKGAAFLRGEPVPLVAIVGKATHHNVGYLKNPDGSEITCTIHDFLRGEQDAYWQGINYEIHEGEIIRPKTP